MKVQIKGFKSIESASLEFKPLTIIMGPPASGKSNLLEALATLGYTLKLVVERDDYKHVGLGTLDRYVRSVSCNDLIYRHQLTRKAHIMVDDIIELRLSCNPEEPSHLLGMLSVNYWTAGKRKDYKLEIPVRGRKPRLGEYRFKDWGSSSGNEDLSMLLSLLSVFLDLMGKERVEPKVESMPAENSTEEDPRKYGELRVPSIRLYSFDRMNVLYTIMYNLTYKQYPHYLAEDASNLGYILYYNEKILSEINDILGEYGGIEVKPLNDGTLAFFDGGREVGPASISDTLLRILYYYTALYTSINTSTLYDENNNHRGGEPNTTLYPVIMLEEPESHLYPVAYRSLVEPVARAIANGAKVVISTHSGRLATLLSSEIPDTVVYLLDREHGGASNIYRVDTRKLAERLEDLEDLVLQPRRYIRILLDEGVLAYVG